MTAGQLERPGPIGRAVRVVAGVGLLLLFARALTRFPMLVGLAVPTRPMLWFGVLVSFYFLAAVVNRGFGRSWGRWPQLVFALLALVAVVLDFARYGTAWGPPLGFLVFLLVAYVTGHLGLSFILAGILATPG